MDHKSSHPMWFSSFSSRVAPKPLTYIEGEGPPMPKACLPWISPRRFNPSHDSHDSPNENGNWNVRVCTRVRNSTRSTKSNSDRGEEPDSPSMPVCGPSFRPAAECIIQALENGRTDLHQILSRSPSCMPFFDSEGEFVQGIRKLQKLMSILQSYGMDKIFTSCMAANSELQDIETESAAEIHSTPPDPFFSTSPGRKSLACAIKLGNGFPPELEMALHANIATRIDRDTSESLGQPGCLRLETKSHSDAIDTSECYFPPNTYLPPMELENVVRGMKTLVLNLNGTLIHPSLELTDDCDFRIPAWVNGRLCEVLVVKRPGLDKFLQTVARMYEVVVFTSCSRQYTDLVLDMVDRKRKCIRYRLYQDACTLTEEGWLKDLSGLGRDLRKVITVDCKPSSYSLQPANLLQVGKYTGDKTDSELDDLLLELELVWRLNV